MVYYSEVARNDLKNILWGLANWEKHPLSFEHAASYVSDIRKEADTICTKLNHRKCTSELHLRYGEKIHIYKRIGILFTAGTKKTELLTLLKS